MPSPYLQASLNGIVVRFEGYIFENGQLARQINPDSAGTVNKSPNGGTFITGSADHPDHTFTFSVATDLIIQYQPDLPDEVRNLWSEYDEQRRAGNDPTIALEDGSQYFFESSPRTRPLATGASEIATTTGRIKYYAVYNVGFTRPPEYQIGEGFTIQWSEGVIRTL